MLVPAGVETSVVEICLESANSTWQPTSSSVRLVFSVTSETAAIEANASPLKPTVNITVIWSAPASTAFSISSLTAEDGR